MKISHVIVAAALAGCGVAQPQLPPASTAGGSAHPLTWMSPGAAPKSLVYVSDYSAVDVYDYESSTQVGTLSYFSHAGGSCTDAHGNVYITNIGSADILEFAHGGAKPTYIIDPTPYPVDCAVNRANGNLAVINEYGSSQSSPGNVTIYAGGKGKPQVYKSPFSTPLVSGAYDAKGNLLVSSYGSNTFNFALLPAGQTKLQSISIPHQTDWYGPPYVRWDGEYFVINYRAEYVDEPVIFVMYTIKGSGAIQEGYGVAERAGESGPFWLGRVGGPKTLHRANRVILCSSYDYGGISYYYYPELGASVFGLNLNGDEGVTVSPT